jgi:hypothetical protein
MCPGDVSDLRPGLGVICAERLSLYVLTNSMEKVGWVRPIPHKKCFGLIQDNQTSPNPLIRVDANADASHRSMIGGFR